MDRIGWFALFTVCVVHWAGAPPTAAQEAAPDTAADTTADATADTTADTGAARAADTVPGAVASPAKTLAVSGFVTGSYNYATGDNDRFIPGRLYERFHNEFIANAAKVALELPVATDRVDGGARIDILFGQDAEFTKSAGLSLGDQGDLLQAFAMLNVPFGEGRYVQLKAGKMATLIGLEVMDDVVNPNFSIGNQFFFVENFTNTGFRVDVKPAALVDVQVAVFNGWDLVSDNNDRKSFMARLGLTPDDRTTIGLIGYFGPEQANDDDNDRYGGEVTITRNLGERAAVWLEGDYGEEQGARLDGQKAKWWALGLWFTYDLTSRVGLALRGDYVDDEDGARSTANFFGTQQDLRHKFGSATVTVNVRPVESILVRPEVRYDRSDRLVYDNFTRKDNVSFALAASYLF